MSNSSEVPNRADRLEIDVDSRLSNLWRSLDDAAFDMGLTSEQVAFTAAYMRAGYGKGYCDALEELPYDHGRLIKDHGYQMPTPKPLPVDPEIRHYP